MSARRAFRRIGVQRRGQERAPEPLVERALAAHRLADRRALPLQEHAERREIFAQAPCPGTRFFRSNSHHGSRPSLRSSRQRSPLPRSAKSKTARAGIAQRRARADPVEIVERRAVARQQEMVAVVDDEAERRIEIGPAAAAREGRRLMHDDRDARHRRGAPRR